MTQRDKKRRSLFIPVLTLIFLLVIAGVVLFESTEKGKVYIGNIKTSVAEALKKLPLDKLLKKLPLDKIPFLKGLFPEKEEAAATPEEMPEESILVKVYKIARRDFEDTLPSLGTLKGYREMNLKFEVNGVIDSINFREGEEVREGDIIASLDQYDALLKLKYSQIELDKSKKLFEVGSIIKAKLEQSELEYESAKSDLDKTYLYAPRDSVLGTRDAEIGEFVTSNDKIVTLIDDTDVFAEIGVIERDIGKVSVGQNAKVYVDAYPDTDFKGKVDNVSPVVEGRSRTQNVKIRVSNTKRFLLPGMFARVLVDVYTKENAIVIPNTALNKTEEGYVVFVVHKKEVDLEEDYEVPEEETPEDEFFIMEDAGDPGVAEARAILFEYRSSDFSVIKEGLEEEDLVVVETQEKLKDQTNVIITEVQEQFL
ncbi:MAG: efflux RND transporter periplasmic adaptor subunit [Candidatus Omnitrophota bacterium]